MTRPSSGALLGATLLVYLLAAGTFLLLSYLGAPPALLDSMVRSHSMTTALLRTVESLPALSIAGLLVAFTLFARGGGVARGATVQTVVRPALVVLMVLTLGYLLADALAAPRLRSTVAALVESSARATVYLERMDDARARAEKSGSSADWAEARDSALRYLLIDPTNEGVDRLETSLHESLLEARDREAKAAAAMAGGGERPVEDPTSPAERLRLATQFLEEGDYYSAHYFGTLALANPEVAVLAAKVVEEANARITPGTPLDEKATPEEVAARELARLKREAYALYQREEWVPAYYRFGELALQYPEDEDIRRFHEQSRDRALRDAFLLDDAVAALHGEGPEGLLWVTRAGPESEITSIGKMVRSETGTWFEDLETLRYRPGGGPTYHVYARYGKLDGDAILLRALGATREDPAEEPVVLVTPATDELAVVLRPALDLESVEHIRPDPSALRGIPALTLWGMQTWAREAGVLGEALDLELLLFFVRPAMFLALGLLGTGAAIGLRGRYFGRPSIVAWTALGLFPFALSGVWQLAADGARLLYGAVIAAGGFVPAIVTAAVVQGLLLVVGLIVLSRSALE